MSVHANPIDIQSNSCNLHRMKNLASIIALIFTFNICHAQERKLEFQPSSVDKPVKAQASFWQTQYYDAEWKLVKKKKDAVYYRLPVLKNGDRYEVEFFRIDGKRYRTASYFPEIVNYQLTLDDGIAKKDGLFTWYDESGEIELQGWYKNNVRDGEWKHYKNGLLKSTDIYDRGNIKSRIYKGDN